MLPSRSCRRNGLFAVSALVALPFSAALAQEPAPKVNIGIGWSSMQLDDFKFVTVTDFLVTEVQDHQTNLDGELNGYKLNAELTGLMPRRYGDWQTAWALKGFFARYDAEQESRCNYSGTNTDCAIFPLFDPDRTSTSPSVSGGFFSEWLTHVERKVTYWGGAVEVDLSRPSIQQASLKDAPVVVDSLFHWRAGVAVRRLEPNTSLVSEDFGPTLDPVTLHENLDATYYGGYFGFSTVKPFESGFRVKLSGDTGLYYANSNFKGTYTATSSLGAYPDEDKDDNVVGSDGAPIQQSMTLSDSAPAVISQLQIAFERDFGSATVALFGEAEWISYVPKVLYNDTDINDGPPFDIRGSQDGTALGDGSAISYTVGARVSYSFR